MTRIAFVSDVHVGQPKTLGGPTEAGLNVRCRQILKVLEDALALAAEQGCEAFVVCGDLLDSSRTEPQVLAAVQALFSKHEKMAKLVLRGNHEMVTEALGDNSLGPLAPVAEVVEVPTIHVWGDVAMLMVPFQSGDAEEYIPRAAEALAKKDPYNTRRVLCFHAGIRDDDTPPWLKEAHDAINASTLVKLQERENIDVIAAGNWHDAKQWNEGRITQMGALCPTGFNNPGPQYGCVAIYDSRKRTTERRWVAGPRFLKRVEDVDFCPKGSTIYMRLPEAQTAPPGCFHVEIEEDTAEAQAALRTAAALTRSLTSLEEAVAAYVSLLPLEDEAMRPHVLARVQRYLGAA